MIHIKWLIALVLTTVLSSVSAAYIAHKITEEEMIVQITDALITNDRWYAQLLQEANEEKFVSVKTKLEWLRALELKQLDAMKKRLEAACFPSRNAEALDDINRYVAASVPTKKP